MNRAGAHVAFVLALAACGGSDRAPLELARGEIAHLCGESDTSVVQTRSLGGGRIEGCPLPVQHENGRWYASGDLYFTARDDKLLSVRVELLGAESDVDELRRRAMRVVAPLLDDSGERIVRHALQRTYRVSDADLRPRAATEFQAGPVDVDAYTGLGIEQPWRRAVGLRLSFIEHPAGEMPRVPEAEFASRLGVVTDDVRRAWRALCRDDARMGELLGTSVSDPIPEEHTTVPSARWSSGDLWARCIVRDATTEFREPALIDIVWAPESHRVVAFRVTGEHSYGDAWMRVADAFLTRVATVEQRRCALETRGACPDVGLLVRPADSPQREFRLQTMPSP